MIFEYIIVGPFEVNCYIVGDEGTREAMVVDPGGGEDRILLKLAEHGLRLTNIVLTHTHIDHIGGLNVLKNSTGAPISFHRKERMVAKTVGLQGLFLGMGLKRMPPADRLLDEGDRVAFGDLSLDVIHTPGHSPGGISLVSEEGGFVLVGDTLFAGSIGRTDLPGGSYKTLIQSIREKIIPLGDEVVVYPGHGPQTTVRNERLYNPFLRVESGKKREVKI